MWGYGIAVQWQGHLPSRATQLLSCSCAASVGLMDELRFVVISVTSRNRFIIRYTDDEQCAVVTTSPELARASASRRHREDAFRGSQIDRPSGPTHHHAPQTTRSRAEGDWQQ